jgi:hypothetical protein
VNRPAVTGAPGIASKSRKYAMEQIAANVVEIPRL